MNMKKMVGGEEEDEQVETVASARESVEGCISHLQLSIRPFYSM